MNFRSSKHWIMVFFLVIYSMSTNAQNDPSETNDQKLFDISKNTEVFTEVLYNLQTYLLYDVEPNTLAKKAIDAMLDTYDPYTRYFTEGDMQDYLYMRTGKYEGLGITFFKGRDSNIVVSEVVSGGEAENSGLRIGDTINSVNGQSLINMKVTEVRDFFQKVEGTDIQIDINAAYTGKRSTISIDKGIVKKDKLGYVGWLDDKKSTAIIKLNKFTPACGQNIELGLDSLFGVNPDFQNIIIDLRSNPGGLLQEAVNIVDLFVDKNKLVVYTQGKFMDDRHEYSTRNNAKFETQNLYVLVDSHSASASEIVSGALQDYDRAVIVGQNTFGKGLVQNFKNMSYNTQMKLTTGKYYVPSGRCVQALDYERKDSEGKPYQMKENERQTFKTANGRKVKDGRGITPDVVIPLPKSELLSELESKHLIFEFVSYNVDVDGVKKSDPSKEPEVNTQEFYDWLADTDAWLSLPIYENWNRLMSQNEKDGLMSKKSLSTIQSDMQNTLISKLKSEESALKRSILDEIERRAWDDFVVYDAHKKTDEYMAEVNKIINNNSYKKIVNP